MRPKVKEWLENQESIKLEPSPPDTAALDGAAERSGGVVKDQARSIREGAKFSSLAGYFAISSKNPRSMPALDGSPSMNFISSPYGAKISAKHMIIWDACGRSLARRARAGTQNDCDNCR